MYSAKQVEAMLQGWAARGLTRAEIVTQLAEACMGWPYVWGSLGEECTVSKRQAYMNREVCPAGDKELIRKRCQVLNGSSGACNGCKYYPGDSRTRIFDCRGFTRWLLKQVGITLNGAGATSQWNTEANWAQKGPISEMPPNTVCCVFKQVNGKTMDHTGMCVGDGRIIHCSVEVKEGKTTDKGWTHYAIPKGLYGIMPGPSPEPSKPTLRKGSSGEYVTYLQSKLKQLGYDIGYYGIDGKFGTKTEEAVKMFQFANHLSVDGIVGPKTWEMLDGENPKPEQTYSVRITKLTKAQADELKHKYVNAVVDEE